MHFGNVFTGCLALLVIVQQVAAADWLQFRGANGASAASDAAPPVKWNDASRENVAWRIDLPGKAACGPIVVKGRVIVTASSGAKQDRLHVLAYDAETGRPVWSREFWATGRTLTHPYTAVAAPTPASDGERIFAFFSSNDLICLNLDGDLLWYRGLGFDYPKAGNDIGMASSPVVVGDSVVVQIESQADSFATGLNTQNGETRWRVDRDRRANWSSPVALPGERNGRHVVLLQSGSGLTAHDSLTGDELWRYQTDCSTMASPVVVANRVFLPSNGVTVLELPRDATAPALVWDSNQLSSSGSSPVVAGDYVYAINSAGVVTCGEAKSGKRLWQVRVGGRHWVTPVVAGNRLYCIDQDGVAHVVQLGEKGDILAKNEFGEAIKGSPAVADGALFVRSDTHLWKIAE